MASSFRDQLRQAELDGYAKLMREEQENERKEQEAAAARAEALATFTNGLLEQHTEPAIFDIMSGMLAVAAAGEGVRRYEARWLVTDVTHMIPQGPGIEPNVLSLMDMYTELAQEDRIAAVTALSKEVKGELALQEDYLRFLPLKDTVKQLYDEETYGGPRKLLGVADVVGFEVIWE